MSIVVKRVASQSACLPPRFFPVASLPSPLLFHVLFKLRPKSSAGSDWVLVDVSKLIQQLWRSRGGGGGGGGEGLSLLDVELCDCGAPSTGSFFSPLSGTVRTSPAGVSTTFPRSVCNWDSVTALLGVSGRLSPSWEQSFVYWCTRSLRYVVLPKLSILPWTTSPMFS